MIPETKSHPTGRSVRHEFPLNLCLGTAKCAGNGSFASLQYSLDFETLSLFPFFICGISMGFAQLSYQIDPTITSLIHAIQCFSSVDAADCIPDMMRNECRKSLR